MMTITSIMISISLIFISIFAVADTSRDSDKQPNIIFMLSDDQDWTGLSIPMHPDMENSRSDFYQTPNIDKLAHQGVRFSHAYPHENQIACIIKTSGAYQNDRIHFC